MSNPAECLCGQEVGRRYDNTRERGDPWMFEEHTAVFPIEGYGVRDLSRKWCSGSMKSVEGY